jgi:integrase
MPYRVVAARPVAMRNGRIRPDVVARFCTQADAAKELARLLVAGDTRQLSVERIARGRRHIGTFDRKAEAEKAERDALTAKDRGVDIVPSALTIVELVGRYVDNQETRGECGVKAAEEYRRSCRLYIEPHFRDIAIRKLRPAALNEWVVTLMRSGGQGGNPISARTAKHAFSLLKAAMRWGVRMQIVSQNVCDLADAPVPSRSETRALTADEVAALLATARGSRWEHFVELALLSGARRGELLALSWPDIDLDAGTIMIRASLSQSAGRVMLKSTKTDRVRMVPLIPAAIDVLRRQRVQQNADRLAAGEVYVFDARRPVFTDEIGTQLTPKAATNAFARIAKKAGVSTTSLHSTRHTAATQLIAAGVDVRTVSSILGHSTPTTTLAVYAHAVEGVTRAAMDTLGGRIDRMKTSKPTEEAPGMQMVCEPSSAKKKSPSKRAFNGCGDRI